MTDLFLDVLNTSVSAIWVVLGVVLARLLLKKAPRWMVCSLWALVALRLVFGGFEAPFSLIPSPELIPPESLFDQAPVIHSGVPIVDNIVNPVYTESLRPAPGASVNPLQVWLAVFANIWLLGMVVMCLWAVISCHRVRRQVRESIPADGVFLCDRIESPFIFGLFRPKIYLPSTLDEASRGHVIAHEQAHIARRDHWWKPLGFALLTVNWFNPAMWLAYLLLCRDIELACDEKVVRNYSPVEKKAYSSSLLSCSINSRSITACPLAFGEVGVKQRVKSVLNYKKPAFWVILATVVLTAVLAVSLLTNPQTKQAEIRYNGVLYVQDGDPTEFVPDQQQHAGTLRSVLHDSTEHPQEDGQAVRLDWEYAGQPMVLVGSALYLEVPGGGMWLKFNAETPHKFVSETLEKELDYVVCAEGRYVDEWESLPDDRRAELSLPLKDLQTASFEPVRENALPEGRLSIYLYQDSLTCSMNLTLGEDDSWYLHFYEPEFGSIQYWKLRSSALTEWASPYLDRTEYYDSIFSEQEAVIVYHTFQQNALSLNVGIPHGWQAEALTSDSDAAAFQFQPEGRTGWIHVHLFPEEARLDIQMNDPTPAELPNGISGTVKSLHGDQWESMQLDTTRGTLLLTMTRDVDWWDDLGTAAEAILGSLRAYDDGEEILGKPNLLGITLNVEHATPNGATLVCTQDGGLWDQITTGAPWNLERYEDGQWVGVMPESTAWTSIAYGLNRGNATRWNINWSQIIGPQKPGQYRISKHFRGEKRPPFSLGIEREVVEQVCYAEFTIDADDSTVQNTAYFSEALYQALREDWDSYAALSWEERMFSSHLPGHCAREFDDWAAVEQFVGMKLPNPLESLSSLEKGNWAGMPEGYNGGSRFYVTFYGTREGQVQWVKIECGYRRDKLRVCESLKLTPDSLEHPQDSDPVFTADSGLEYEGCTGTLNRGPIEYEIRVTGGLGTGNELSAVLDDLLPYFEEISA